MKKIEKKVDLQAHITELTVEIVRENEKNMARICLKNVSGKTIKRIVFMAQGQDYFGSTILVDGKEKFWIVLDGFSLDSGERLLDFDVSLEPAIRQLVLEEASVTFLDETSEEKLPEKAVIYYVDTFMQDSYKDKPELDDLREQNEKFCCYPKEEPEGWICACGYLNRAKNERCVNCGSEKTEVFTDCSKETSEKRRREKHHAFLERMRKRDEAYQRRECLELTKFILEFIIGIILVAVLIWLMIHHIK